MKHATNNDFVDNLNPPLDIVLYMAVMSLQQKADRNHANVAPYDLISGIYSVSILTG